MAADRPDHDLADRARALLDAAKPQVCRSCNGTGWVDDQNWWPEDWQIRAGVQREEAAGLIPCGACSHGDWSTYRDERTEPTMVEDRLDRSEVLDLIAGLLAERDEYLRQLDTLRNELSDALGLIVLLLDQVGGKATITDRELVALDRTREIRTYVTDSDPYTTFVEVRPAAAVGDPEEGRDEQ